MSCFLKRKVILALAPFFVSLPCVSFSQEICLDVKIFTGFSIYSVTIEPVIGKYTVYFDDKALTDVLKSETISLTADSNHVKVYKNREMIARLKSVNIAGSGVLNAITIKPIAPDGKERTYEDDLLVTSHDGVLMLINHTSLEHYVAGVVQSEGGGSVKDNEFYLVQAVACRTYALNNIKKHAAYGFNLCDSVHCQLYAGRCKNNNILSAVYKTAGDVIVDKNKNMISAAFHSNSGGQTVNSEDIWQIPTTYLKSVSDTFSLKMPNATWEKRIPKTEWLNFLNTRFGYNINDSNMRHDALQFKQDTRKAVFPGNIPLGSIRTGLGLRSTFFSIVESGSDIVFLGKGYGHGVGLSQQGAIRMAQLGYKFDEIIKFYYKDVEIMPYDQINTH